jgi:hypothetical protein
VRRVEEFEGGIKVGVLGEKDETFGFGSEEGD